MNFNNSNVGLIREGCLPSQYGPLSLDMQQGTEFVVPGNEKSTFDRRYLSSAFSSQSVEKSSPTL
jgi:hypothetical protein